MARKSSAAIEEEIATAEDLAWRVLVRKPAFLQDVRDLERQHPASEANVRRYELSLILADKWGVPAPLILSASTWNEAIQGPLEEALVAEGWSLNPPVVAHEQPEALTPATPDPGRFLFLRVDIGQPVERLLASTELLLRRGTRQRPHGKKRPRVYLQALRFQLQVFDLHQTGLSFKNIAVRLRRKKQTVKSAYGRVLALLQGSVTSIDPSHFETCPVCSKGKRLCRLVEAIANKGWVGRWATFPNKRLPKKNRKD